MSKYLFIDGAYLTRTFEGFGRRVFKKPDVPIDYSKIQFATEASKVFYYNAPPEQKQGESTEDFNTRKESYENLVSKLYELPNWHVAAGVVKTRRIPKPHQTQKEVDVLIAVDMLSHTMRRNATEMAFIAGDRDFRPLIEALVREGMNLHLLYDPLSIDQELRRAADIREPLNIPRLYAFLASNFQHAHPIPNYGKTIAGVPYAPHSETIEEATAADGLPVTTHRLQNNAEYIAIKHEVDTWTPHEYATSNDQAALKRFAQHMWRCDNWRKG
jgi:uncharacterized LabA/DUF88 family protein